MMIYRNRNGLPAGRSVLSVPGIVLLFCVFLTSVIYGQKPYRIGTTAANFLEIGYGSAGNSMGDAYVSMVRDLSAVYWNPAGLGYMDKNEFQISYQPWLVDINTSFVGFGYVHQLLGTFAVSVIQTGYGDEEVTTIDMQEGTGENYSGQDMAFTVSFGRRLAEWFSFGASGKYIYSTIWHESAKAAAFDLGAIVNTAFLSPSGNKADGLNIGVSITNYGTKMKFDGIDLKQPVDILPDEQGNYAYVPARFELQSWELPLIFRIGVSFNPVLTNVHKFTLSMDALHANNNSESVNMGGQYQMTLQGKGIFSLRGGYKALFMDDSEYGLSFGAGVQLFYLNNKIVKIDYGYRDMGILKDTHSFTFGILF